MAPLRGASLGFQALMSLLPSFHKVSLRWLKIELYSFIKLNFCLYDCGIIFSNSKSAMNIYIFPLSARQAITTNANWLHLTIVENFNHSPTSSPFSFVIPFCYSSDALIYFINCLNLETLWHLCGIKMQENVHTHNVLHVISRDSKISWVHSVIRWGSWILC